MWLNEQHEKGREPSEEQIAAQREKIEADVAENKQKALEAGGLYVIGTERHESRRIDNQLRGRSGRQGDPGASKFYLSLEDDLMRIFGSDRMDSMLQKLGLEEGEAIVHPWINKALERAQSKVEARNFDARKNILKYDDVMNDQRKVVFDQRIELMQEDDLSDTVRDMRHQVIDDLVGKHIPEKAYPEQWDVDGLKEEMQRIFGLDLPIADWAAEEGIADEEIRERLIREADSAAAKKVAEIGPEMMRHIEKAVLLQTLDNMWREHLVTLEHLRQVIGLRGFGQRDPLNEYKTEGFELFETMLANLREQVTGHLMHVSVDSAPSEQELEMAELPEMSAHHVDPLTGADEFEREPEMALEGAEAGVPARGKRGNGGGTRAQPMRNKPAGVALDPNDPATWGKVSRNAQCPCGSGKKYKHCHGKLG